MTNKKMKKPEHQEYTITIFDSSSRGIIYELRNEGSSTLANDFPHILTHLLNTFESEYGSKHTYSIKVDDEAKKSLGFHSNVLERIVTLQNKIAEAKAVLR